MRGFKNFLVASLFLFSICAADTFTNRRTGESFDGFATQQVRAGKTLVRSANSDLSKSINLSDYDIRWNFKGRRNQVIVLSIKDEISLDCETTLFEKAMESASNQGPLFIILEIDTPGGRGDLMKRMCRAISDASNCKTVAYICGGQYGGAYSAGAIISLACDYIYMADNTAIGAATPIIISGQGEVKDLKSQYGETVGEKFMSADRAFVAAIAEKNGRSAAVAKAMVDKDIRVVEVMEDGKKEFIESQDRKPDQSMVRTLNESGKLLTLTAAQAVDCNIAEGRANSLEELLNTLGAGDARVIQNNYGGKAKSEFDHYKRNFNKIAERADKVEKEIDRLTDNANSILAEYNKLVEYNNNLGHNYEIRHYKESLRNLTEQRQDVIRDIVKNQKELISLYKEAIDLNKRCPDLNLDVQSFEKAINSAQTSLRQAQEELKR